MTHYAIIETGGKQYRAEEGAVLEVEKLPGEAKGEIRLDRVLLVRSNGDVRIGTPTVAGAVVVARVIEQKRDKKIIVYKMRPKKNYRLTQGHRQSVTRLQIVKIEDGG